MNILTALTTVFFIPARFGQSGFGVFCELPSSLHNGADGISFADGHAEIHKWLDPRTAGGGVLYISTSGSQRMNMESSANADLAWLAQHTPVQP